MPSTTQVQRVPETVREVMCILTQHAASGPVRIRRRVSTRMRDRPPISAASGYIAETHRLSNRMNATLHQAVTAAYSRQDVDREFSGILGNAGGMPAA